MEAPAVKVKHPDLNARELTIEMRAATELAQTFQTALSIGQVELSPESLQTQPAADRRAVSDLGLRPAFATNRDDHYHLASFMQLYDVDFVEAAYRAILKREPDAAGCRFYLEGLRSGRLERVDVINAFLDSDEGQRHKVRVDGLKRPRLLRRVTSLPLIGYPLRVGLDLLRLPSLIRRLHDSIAVTNQLARSRNQEIVDQLNAGNRQWSESINDLAADLAATVDANRLQVIQTAKHAIAEASEAQAAKHDQLRAETQARAGELDSRLGAIMSASETNARATSDQIKQIREVHADLSQYTKTEVANLLTHVRQLREELAVQRARLAVSAEDSSTASKQVEISAPSGEVDRALDALYVELEDRFRGNRDEVKQLQAFYTPLVQSAPNPELALVDLGCGRGEWLELLAEAGTRAIGVDTNRVMIDLCRERGFDIVEQDALEYLSGVPDESLRGVTGFHIIEHLSPEKLMLLLDQILRTVRSGGFVAFETPNPDNLFVSGNYFYFDPSHRHPLPSKLVKLLLESRGFQNVEITPLHPCAEGRFVENDDVSKRLNELFYGPMDYAIVGWKIGR
jgi:O-antigen chain-terminating methyltransferase